MEIYARKDVDGEFKDVKISDSDTLYITFHLSNGQLLKVYPTHKGEQLGIMALEGRLIIEPKSSNMILLSEDMS